MKRLVAFATLALMSCTGTVKKVPQSRATFGDEQLRPAKVVMFAPDCNGPCAPKVLETLQGRLISELTIEGFQVVDGETLFAETRKRHSASAEVEGQLSPLSKFFVNGAVSSESAVTYDDLPPAGKRALFEETRAAGIMSVHVQSSRPEQNRIIEYDLYEVTLRYSLGEDERLGGVVRCNSHAISSNDMASDFPTYSEAGNEIGNCLVDELLQ